MALKKTVSDLSALAFELIGDLKTPITYTRKGAITYDPITEAETSTDTEVSLECVVLSERAVEREASVVTYYDALIMVHASHLEDLVPKETDLVEMKGVVYKVNKVESPPSNPIYKLYLVRI